MLAKRPGNGCEMPVSTDSPRNGYEIAAKRGNACETLVILTLNALDPPQKQLSWGVWTGWTPPKSNTLGGD